MLAAGAGARFGGGKLDADCAGKPLGQWVLDAVAAAGFAPGIIVTGLVAPAFAVSAQRLELVHQRCAGNGQGASVALAAHNAQAKRADLLLLLADMPMVEPAHLLALQQGGGLAATLHPDGSAGVPIFVPHAQLAPFAALTGTRGAGPILRNIPGLRCCEAGPEPCAMSIPRPNWPPSPPTFSQGANKPSDAPEPTHPLKGEGTSVSDPVQSLRQNRTVAAHNAPPHAVPPPAAGSSAIASASGKYCRR